MHPILSKAAAILGAAILALAIAGCDAPSTDENGSKGGAIVGTYETKDTQGNPMTITLGENGIATGDRSGEALDGSWKEEEDGAVMITWSDEWRTRIAKDGDSYTKTAYKGGTIDGGTVPAKKTK